ncbi:membrane-bound lytic murein transglycosylase D [Sideroxyarcus emersonii]|uniref:Membrane-bound lytic murein transglycosylase D n=1 Tax=Sideroxyarcus emersonii TaxID=2764705 RepID=A0AAN1X9C7_9PROT|nr:transglycosylase SLT domain-containing protein [Sideroxyarcus emersonii]BCK87327.1 membrane-bound lytic murein transglycosylase D [Sideroxyarcus emersonii]
MSQAVPAVAASGIPAAPDSHSIAATANDEPETQAPAPIREAMIVAPEYSNGDLWQRIRAGFAMHDLNSPLIKRHEKWYANHPDYVLRMSERAQRYLFYIMEEVDRRGMPSEIALLPIIESAFNPSANSIASASGIWQFIPSTGKHFGMEQNWWHDGRRDIIGATNGALDYLQKLHDQFGDWELALAAYNWGENGVTRAQAYNRKHHKPTDYAHLRMPRETRNYVPKLLAVKNIVADPARFGLQLAKIPDEPYFATVATSQHIDVKVAAELADISMDEFMALNPGHNRPVILQEKDGDNVLLLPVDKVDTFRSNLAKTNQRLVSWQPYESKKGESFENIATHFGLTLAELRAANGLSKYAQESNGQTLLVPIGDEEPAAQFAAFNMQPSAIAEMYGSVRYTVRKGDTISTIARRFHVSQAQLRESNHGSAHLRVGQHFNIVLADHHRSYRKRNIVAAKAKRSKRKTANVKVAYNR